MNELKRLFAECGLEIWIQGRDYLVCTRDTRYGKFYPRIKYSYNELFNIDPVIRTRLYGVVVKKDPSDLDQNLI